MKKIRIHKSFLIQLVLVLIVLGYIGVRAQNLSFTHDESFTYKFLIGTENPANTANHHILNTELMNVSQMLFGMSEFSLRLPNVLAFILYVIGYFLITNKTQKIRHSWLLFSLYFFNPFVLDFFSLARGYGLSLGFISMSLYGFLRLSTSKLLREYYRYLIITFLFATLSMFSNLAVINYFIVIWGLSWVFFFLLLRKNPSPTPSKEWWKFGGILVLFLFPILVGIKRLLWLKSIDQLYYGTDSFFHTVSSFVADTLYAVDYPEIIYLSLRIIILVVIGIGVLVLLVNFRKIFKLDVLILFPLLLLGLILENWLFGAKFPMGRTVLYLYPLGLLFVARWIQLYSAMSSIKWITMFFDVLLGLTVCYHCAQAANVKFAANWKYDSQTKEVMKQLKKIEEEGSNPTFSHNWLFEPSVNYYRALYQMNMSPSSRDGIDEKTEFVYGFENELDTTQYKVVSRHEIAKTVFVKKDW